MWIYRQRISMCMSFWLCMHTADRVRNKCDESPRHSYLLTFPLRKVLGNTAYILDPFYSILKPTCCCFFFSATGLLFLTSIKLISQDCNILCFQVRCYSHNGSVIIDVSPDLFPSKSCWQLPANFFSLVGQWNWLP